MSPRQIAHEQARQLLADMDIRIIETRQRRGEGDTCAVATVAAIIQRYDLGHATLVVRSIAETAGNERQLIAPVLWSVSDLVAGYPDWSGTSQWLEAFDGIDIGAFVNEARLNRTACPMRPAITTYLGAMLREVFDPNRKRRRKLFTRARRPAQHHHHQQVDSTIIGPLHGAAGVPEAPAKPALPPQRGGVGWPPTGLPAPERRRDADGRSR